MANLVKIESDQVRLPHLGLTYSITPKLSRLQEGLEAYRNLTEDISLQSLPLPKRREVTHFMRQFGGLLFSTIFPNGYSAHLDGRAPLLLQAGKEWHPYPWEWLNDGKRWFSLGAGLMRFVADPAPAVPPPPLGGPLRVLAVSANPLPDQKESAFAKQSSELGSRFISTVGMLMDERQPEGSGSLFRAVEHASATSLEKALDGSPHLLYFSGYSEEEGWFLESAGLGPERVGREWLLAHLGKAVREGLRGLMINDSLGLLRPEAAAGQTADFFRSGLPGLVRVEGRQARLREQDYLRALVQGLSGGASLPAAHLAGIRRLYRRFGESWDWSFIRLYMRSLPVNGNGAPKNSEVSPGSTIPVEPEEHPLPTFERGFQSLPTPPIFRPRRRVFARHGELAQLAEALDPDATVASPLVFLSGPAGSGKTVLALEIARRIQRRFAQVVYLDKRGLLPDPAPFVTPALPENSQVPVEARLLGELARLVGGEECLAAPWPKWEESLRQHLAGGPPRLVILDNLEGHPGQEDLLKALEKFPLQLRVLSISRARPLLLTGKHIDLPALDSEELARTFRPDFLRRLRASSQREALLEACGSDLLCARMLWRLHRWPDPKRLEWPLKETAEIAEDPDRHGRSGLAELLFQAALAELSRDALTILEALSLFTYLAHREVLAHLTALEGRRLNLALAELQWLGLVEAYDSERYYALQARLQALAGRRLLNARVYGHLRALLLPHYQSLLASMGNSLKNVPAAAAKAPLVWGEPLNMAGEGETSRLMHRVGLEMINVAELASILAEEKDWRELRRLAEAARSLNEIPALGGLMQFINRLLLEAGMTLGDDVLQAAALNGLARPLLAGGEAGRAQPLLEQALNLLGDTEGWEEMEETYRLLAGCYEALGVREAALNMLHSAFELARQLDDTAALVKAAAGLTRNWMEQKGGLEQSERFLAQIIHQMEEREQELPAAELRSLQGDLLLGAGRIAEARELFGAALQVYRKLNDTPAVYKSILRISSCHLAEEQPDEALDWFMRARNYRGGRELAEEERTLNGICEKFSDQGRPKEALDSYLILRDICLEMGNRKSLIDLLDTVGGLYYQLGEQAQSTRCYEERLQLQAEMAPS